MGTIDEPRYIYLSGDGGRWVATVDAADWLWLSKHRWQAHNCGGKWYASRTVGSKKQGWRCLFMHRAILAAPKGVQVDHRNGDGLDNRRANVRLATLQQNRCNARLRNPNGERGIHQKNRCGSWYAQIQVNRKKAWLGSFPDKGQAAAAYSAAAHKYHGEFAALEGRP